MLENENAYFESFLTDCEVEINDHWVDLEAISHKVKLLEYYLMDKAKMIESLSLSSKTSC